MKKTLFKILAAGLSVFGIVLINSKLKIIPNPFVGFTGWLNAAMEVIKHYEGFFPDVYDDPIGIPTIGYGHVMKTGDPEHVTEAQASAWLKQEIEEEYGPQAFAALESKGYDVSSLSDMQKAAVVSFAYNLGPGCVSSATWPQKWKNGDRDAAGISWKAHNKAGGNPLPGLVRRRFTEWLMFAEGTYSTSPAGWEEYYENL